ncbi:hypothetical protein DDJ76_23230 [Mycobacteroides abscessus]|nr:hypothetical protein DDJ76_23230 [Mycobacteroides abscessus]
MRTYRRRREWVTGQRQVLPLIGFGALLVLVGLLGGALGPGAAVLSSAAHYLVVGGATVAILSAVILIGFLIAAPTHRLDGAHLAIAYALETYGDQFAGIRDEGDAKDSDE